MKILNCISLFLALSLQAEPLPLQDGSHTALSRFTETARAYMKNLLEYGKSRAQTASSFLNNLKDDLMSKINNLKNRGKANIDEVVDNTKDFENFSKEDIQKLIEEFYKSWGMDENGEKLDGEKSFDENVENEKVKEENKKVDEAEKEESKQDEKDVL